MTKDCATFEAENLHKSYGGRPILRGLSFQVRKGEIVGLLGPNGAGKTTAFQITMGLAHQEKGLLRLSGDEISNLPMYQRARLGMGYLAQEPSIFRGLTARENILAILEQQTLTRKVRWERADALLQELHLLHLADKQASTLSGGERRRLEIARTLASEPTLLLLDEPFANIDPLAIEEVKELSLQLIERGISILITDHNARELFSICNRCYLICDGQSLLQGTPAELAQNPIAQQHYLGSQFRL